MVAGARRARRASTRSTSHLRRTDREDPATNEDAHGRAAHHGHGPRRGQGGTGLLEHGHRDGAGQLPRAVHHLAAGRRLELRRLLAGAGPRRRGPTTRWCSTASAPASSRSTPTPEPSPTPTTCGTSADRRWSRPARRTAGALGPAGRRTTRPRSPLGAVVGARSGDKGGNANVGRVGPRRRRLRLAAPVPDRRAAAPAHAGRDRGPRRAPLRAAQPAGAQLRDHGPARPRRGRLDPPRPAGQGPRRVPAGQGGRPPDAGWSTAPPAPPTLDHLPPPTRRPAPDAVHRPSTTCSARRCATSSSTRSTRTSTSGRRPASSRPTSCSPSWAQLGILGLEYDPAYGGQGADHSYTVVYGEEMGRAGCGGVPMAVSVQTDMATPSLHRFGSHELKERYLAPGHRGARWWRPSP